MCRDGFSYEDAQVIAIGPDALVVPVLLDEPGSRNPPGPVEQLEVAEYRYPARGIVPAPALSIAVR